MQKYSSFFATGFFLLTCLNLSFVLFSTSSQNANTPIGVVSADKMNVLYIGADNPISAAISDVPIEQTKVSISEGTLTKTDKKGQYNAKVNTPGRATIVVEGVTNQGKTIRKEFPFRVKRMAYPTGRFGNKSGGRMSIAKFKAQEVLTVLIPDCDYEMAVNVMSFDISTSRKGGDITTVSNQGGILSKEVREFMQQGKVGDVYFFENIRVKGSGGIGCPRKLPPFSFKLH